MVVDVGAEGVARGGDKKEFDDHLPLKAVYLDKVLFLNENGSYLSNLLFYVLVKKTRIVHFDCYEDHFLANYFISLMTCAHLE